MEAGIFFIAVSVIGFLWLEKYYETEDKKPEEPQRRGWELKEFEAKKIIDTYALKMYHYRIDIEDFESHLSYWTKVSPKKDRIFSIKKITQHGINGEFYEISVYFTEGYTFINASPYWIEEIVYIK